MFFQDRTEAGLRLIPAIQNITSKESIVYALPRGGVVIGTEIAKFLHLPLTLLIVRKIGHPENPEYAVGAVTEKGPVVLNQEETDNFNPEWLLAEVEKQRQEAKRRRLVYLKGKDVLLATDKTALVVDDGIATGLTMLAAIREIKQQKPKRVIAAVPIASPEAVELLSKEADRVVYLSKPKNFIGSVGAYYRNFPQLNDDEVIKLLKIT